MPYSKRQFVIAAFEEAGLASYVYDLTPDQLNSALQRLDAMIAYWNGRGVRVSYPLPGSPENSDIDTATRVPDWANLAIITNLAKSISPSYGKTPSPETILTAKQTFDALIAKSTTPPIREIPANTPAGAGNSGIGVFMPSTEGTLEPDLERELFAS